jgi:hypothetical protein
MAFKVSILETPELMLESLIEDTFNNKVEWITDKMDHGNKSTAIITISGTIKFLKFTFYEMGTASFIKTEFYKGPNIDSVEFESINAQKERERLVRLASAIRRQNDIRSSSEDYKLMRRNKTIAEIRRKLLIKN